MQQEKIRTIHVYFEEEKPPIVDAVPEQGQQTALPPSRLPLLYLVLVALWGIGVPGLTILFGLAFPSTYDTTIAKTLTFTLSQHPGRGQLPLYTLPSISITKQATVVATGSVHQDATKATGLITFYNGAFTTQTVPARTTLRSKGGIAVVTSQQAVIPPATPTTPPTYGTVSVRAVSSISGSVGNIPASDIDQACCGASILAQNLDAFSGGQDAQDITVLTEDDLSNGRQALTAQVDNAVNTQAQREVKPGTIMLPIGCTTTFVASHQVGDQASSSLLALTKICTLLAYSTTDIEKLAQRSIAIPQGYRLLSSSAFVVTSHVTTTRGTLTVRAIIYLKQDRSTVRSSRFI